MHTTPLSAVIAVMICKAYGVRIICYVDAVDIWILINTARDRVASGSHDHRTSIISHFYSAMGQIDQTIFGVALCGKPGVTISIIHIGYGLI